MTNHPVLVFMGMSFPGRGLDEKDKSQCIHTYIHGLYISGGGVYNVSHPIHTIFYRTWGRCRSRKSLLMLFLHGKYRFRHDMGFTGVLGAPTL
jgi:hypothetical protein